MVAIKFIKAEEDLSNLYAPRFGVEVGGKDLLYDKNLEITSVQVDNTLSGMDQYSFVVNNAFDVETREFGELLSFFKFGAQVQIHMGYLDRKDMALMLTGLITSVKTSFPSQGLPQLTVSGYDLSWCLSKRVCSRSWKDKKDSQVVAAIAREHNLTPKVKDTDVPHPRVEQNQENDFQLIEKLAERNGYEFYVVGKELYFAPPAFEKTEELELEWGRGLFSFSPEANLAEQITAVEIRGWDPEKKKEIIGKARAGQEPGRDSGRKSGGDYLKSICPEAKICMRQPVYSQQEADQRAKALLKKRSEGLLRGSGECVGLPMLRADRNVKIKGVGADFSKTYYVEQTTHSISSSGYRVSFKVKDTTV